MFYEDEEPILNSNHPCLVQHMNVIFNKRKIDVN